MLPDSLSGFDALPVQQMTLVNEACRRFEQSLQDDPAARVESRLDDVPEDLRDVLFRELLLLECESRSRHHDAVSREELDRRFPTRSGAITEVLTRLGEYAPLSHPDEEPVGGDGPEVTVPEAFGRFRPRKVLGWGGFGVVYLAHDPRRGCDVALKVPHLEALLAPPLRRRFIREAEATEQLDHPNLVRVLEVGELGVVCYLAREFVDGPTLGEWARKRRDEERPVAPVEAARLVRTLAEAVQHAHERGVLHCDLKPGNILLRGGDAGRPAITDFGLARLVTGQSDLSHTGQLLGTPAYMAPEQAGGRRKEVTARTDVYALGAILYELLTGRPPFSGPLLETLSRLRTEEPARPRSLTKGVPADLETVCLCCLEKEPGRRYAGAQALADDLARFLAGEPILARPLGRARQAWRWCRRNPAVALPLLVLFLVTASASVALYTLWRQAEASAADARRSAGEAQAAHSRAEGRLLRLRRVLPLVLQLGQDEGPTFSGRAERDLPRLRQAAQDYWELAQEMPGDAALTLEAARVVGSVARVGLEVRALNRSREVLLGARTLWDRAEAQAPGDLAVRIERARFLTRVATALVEVRGHASEDTAREAVRAWESLAGRLTTDRDRIDCVLARFALANELSLQGRNRQSLEEARRCRGWLESILRDNPRSEPLNLALIKSLDCEGDRLLLLGQEAEAVGVLRRRPPPSAWTAEITFLVS